MPWKLLNHACRSQWDAVPEHSAQNKIHYYEIIMQCWNAGGGSAIPAVPSQPNFLIPEVKLPMSTFYRSRTALLEEEIQQKCTASMAQHLEQRLFLPHSSQWEKKEIGFFSVLELKCHHARTERRWHLTPGLLSNLCTFFKEERGN